MTNQLIFEPRRVRVWLAKGVAVALGCGVVALVAIGGFWLAVGVVAQARDISMPAGQVEHVVWHVVRAVALAMGAGLGAFALTMIFRHTVATLALLFVYSIGGEIVVNLLPVRGGRPLVGRQQRRRLAGHPAPLLRLQRIVRPGDRCSSMQTMTHLEAGTFLGVLLASPSSSRWSGSAAATCDPTSAEPAAGSARASPGSSRARSRSRRRLRPVSAATSRSR